MSIINAYEVNNISVPYRMWLLDQPVEPVRLEVIPV